MYKNKTFSIVIPAYNEEVHIKKNIEQFLNTNIFDEIIVVDNNSTDKTSEEIKRLPQFMLKKLCRDTEQL